MSNDADHSAASTNSSRRELQQWATWRELQRQPETWKALATTLDVEGLRDWVAGLDIDEVWFCGAGTSAYIGDILTAGLPVGRGFRSVPSTDLVASPQRYLAAVRPLVVSFGRSGNSAESIGTLDALDALAPTSPRLHITCNPDGILATRASDAPLQVVSLPETANDSGFAMTCSFSTMLLTALAIFDEPCEFAERSSALATQLRHSLEHYQQFVVPPHQPLPERAVFLGTGALAFAARESALKVLELTAGQIPAIWDSTLGFRHGPKSFVSRNTAVTLFLSPDTPARLYELDLLEELRQQFPSTRILSVGPDGDIDVAMPFGALWAVPVCVAAAQVAGVMTASRLGMNVDNPFSGLGTLTRVVADVALYPPVAS